MFEPVADILRRRCPATKCSSMRPSPTPDPKPGSQAMAETLVTPSSSPLPGTAEGPAAEGPGLPQGEATVQTQGARPAAGEQAEANQVRGTLKRARGPCPSACSTSGACALLQAASSNATPSIGIELRLPPSSPVVAPPRKATRAGPVVAGARTMPASVALTVTVAPELSAPRCCWGASWRSPAAPAFPPLVAVVAAEAGHQKAGRGARPATVANLGPVACRPSPGAALAGA